VCLKTTGPLQVRPVVASSQLSACASPTDLDSSPTVWIIADDATLKLMDALYRFMSRSDALTEVPPAALQGYHPA
jgi:hypothetical protein